MKQLLISGILVILFSIGGITLLLNKSQDAPSAASNITTVDGKQVIDITAKGGYAPKTTQAKADIPTQLKVSTNGTYDCSSGLRIPTLSYAGTLPASGETLIDIPPQKAGSKIDATCVMGMYNFSVAFN